MRYLNVLLLTGLISAIGIAPCRTPADNWAVLPISVPKGVLAALPRGQKDPSDLLHLAIALPYRDSVAVQTFVDSVSNPKSPNYRMFLSPGEVGRRFGLSLSAVENVEKYLAAKGMTIKLVAKNRLSILADATVAQAQAAFHTSIEEFTPLERGMPTANKRFSFTTPPNIPASISPYISYVGGLENFTQPIARASLTPGQIRTLYGVAPLYANGFQGQGRTIGISNFDGFRISNVAMQYAQFGLPTPPGGVGSNITVKSIDGADGTTAYAQLEGDLDLQMALGAAPLCNLIVYDDARGTDLIGILTLEADDNSADIISESYGWEGDPTFDLAAHNIHLAMSAQGITYLAASGDAGTASLSACYPVDDPEVLVVGGTAVQVDSAGNRVSETGWNGSGGGWCTVSDPFNILPAYQTGNGVPSTIPYRLLPDVALAADPLPGYQVFHNGDLQSEIGGTSCACPTFAASLADCEQQLIAAGGLPINSAGKQRFGRIQDLLYSYNGDPTVFFDVTSGSNGVLPKGVTSIASPGWDTVTGWGAMNFQGFVNKVLSRHGLESLTISPGSVPGGAAATATLTLSAPAAAGGLTVSLASSSTSAVVPASVTVPAGSTAATFTISTSGLAPSLATVTASVFGVSVTATLDVNPPSLSKVSVAPSTVVGGVSSLGTVTLDGPAPPGGITISLASSSSEVTVPPSVTVADGANSAVFEIGTPVVAKAVTALITATQGAETNSAMLVVNPPTLIGVTLSSDSVQGGSSVTGTVTLNGLAPTGGVTIALGSNNAYAIVSKTISIPAGTDFATFSVTSKAVSHNVGATITASAGTSSESASLEILAPTLVGMGLNLSPIIGGLSLNLGGSVYISGRAPAPGIAVKLSSSNPKIASIPAGVTIPTGKTWAAFTVNTTFVSTVQSVTFTATTPSASQTLTFSVDPLAFSLYVTNPMVTGGSSDQGQLQVGASLLFPAVIHLVSNSPDVVVPATVTMPVGPTLVSYNITTKKVGSVVNATIVASFGPFSTSIGLTVLPPNLVSIGVSPSSVKGGSSAPVTGTVTIAAAAPAGGVVVSLSTSDSSAASVPASVTIPSGKTTATFAITHSPVNAKTSVTIGGTLGGISKTTTLTVTP